MAITTDLERPRNRSRPTDSGPTGLGVAEARDRARDFRRARRHSLAVRLLRTGLPIGALLLSAGYVAVVLRTVGFGSAIAQLPIPRITAENLVMDNPHYEGFNKDGGKYVVDADAAQQDFASPGVIKLKGIRGKFFQPDNTRSDLTAVSGVFDNKANRLELNEKIKVVSTNGMTADLTQATVMTKAGTIESTQPVRVSTPTAQVTARRMTVDQKAKKVAFSEDVKTHVAGQKEGAPAPAKVKGATAGAAPALGSSGAPMDVASDRLDIDDAAGKALFTGKVKAVQGTDTVESERMLVAYERAAGADGKPAPPSATEGAPGAGKVKTITIDTPVVLTRASGERVTADRADVDAARQVSVLTGNVVITAPPDRKVVSDKAEVDQQQDTILLTGAGVHITQGRNELHGRRVLVDRAAKKTYVSAPAEGNAPPAHVTALLYQSKDPPAAGSKKAAKPAPPAQPAEGGFGMTGFKSDPNAPINIDSETLTVDDTAHKAIFRTAVHATQGDLSVNCEEMTAYYTGGTGLTVDPSAQTADGKPAGQLTKLECRKNVVIVSKKGQKAQGDWADFDPKANTAVVGGDVKLFDGDSVVRGSRLTVDMTTGVSNIDTSGGDGAGTAAAIAHKPPKTTAGAEPVVPQQKAGRPSAVFYPRQVKDGAAKALEKATSSWQSTTTPEPKR